MFKPSSSEIFKYEAYGLSIASGIFFPELSPSLVETSDVVIQYGSVPASLNNVLLKTTYCEANSDEFLLDIAGVAKYYVSHGQNIVIEASEQGAESHIVFYLLGIVFGILLHQRRKLVLHGSAVAFKNNCVVFVAPSGFGKSTLAAAFAKRGFLVLTDDVCAIEIDEHSIPYVVPGIPYLKLWDASVDKLGLKNEDLKKLLPDKEKYGIRINQPVLNKRYCLQHIYQLNRSEHADFSIKKLSGITKFNSLKSNLFKEWLAPGLEKRANNFTECGKLSTHVPVSLVTRPVSGFHLEELVDLLINDFEFNLDEAT